MKKYRLKSLAYRCSPESAQEAKPSLSKMKAIRNLKLFRQNNWTKVEPESLEGGGKWSSE